MRRYAGMSKRTCGVLGLHSPWNTSARVLGVLGVVLRGDLRTAFADGFLAGFGDLSIS